MNWEVAKCLAYLSIPNLWNGPFNDVFISSQVIQEIPETYSDRDTVIYLLQNLGFMINMTEPIFHLSQKIEF